MYGPVITELVVAVDARKRQLVSAVGGMFGAGLVHSILPPWETWMRATVGAAAAVVIFLLFALLLPRPPKA